jgi:dUTP pyrophosphatase
MLEYKLTEFAKQLSTFDFKPTQQRLGDAGYDLRACITVKSVSIFPGETVRIPTGVHISLHNTNTVGLLIPRSSLGKRGGMLANTIGVIDSNYQGEIELLILNTDIEECLEIKQGERLAQLVITPIIVTEFTLVDEFSLVSERGNAGFGSSGRL